MHGIGRAELDAELGQGIGRDGIGRMGLTHGVAREGLGKRKAAPPDEGAAIAQAPQKRNLNTTTLLWR